jgi:transmembrane sensor
VAWIDPRGVTGWAEGRILFEDTPLPQALEEINRYLPTPVRIGDSALANVKINGMFRTDQPMSFVRALTSYLPVELRNDAAGPILMGKARR